MLAAYGVGVRRLAARGEPWPMRPHGWPSPSLGVGSYAVVTLGFLGVYSPYLRWAFAAQAALLLLVVPALIALGPPVELARTALAGQRSPPRSTGPCSSRSVRSAQPSDRRPGAAAGRAPALPHAAAAGGPGARGGAGGSRRSLLPLLGLVALLPVAAGEEPASSTTMAIGFLIAFVELIADALPGILLRLHSGIIGAPPPCRALPAWLPTPLRDQQLSGDVLWFLGEAIDLPFLAWLVVRWIRADQREAAVVDARLDEAHDDRPWWEIEAESRGAAPPAAHDD